MGGRGASSGLSDKGKPYGTEYETLHQSGNIKFVRYNDSTAAKTPMETMSKDRIYVTVNSKNEAHSITFYDKDNKRYKQIDIEGSPHKIGESKVLPHTHQGYVHDEDGTRHLTPKEKTLVDKVKRIWQNQKNKR